MKLYDITATETSLFEAKMVWAKRGKSVVRKYRCTFGKRKGRVVSNPGQCSKPIDQKKRLTLRRTKAKVGKRMARKAQRTKRTSSASKRVKALNK